MQIIPVIDLLAGQVVRALKGERSTYRPIESPLCGSSEPRQVAATLLAHCAARRLYVADLDGLLGGAPQAALLARLLRQLPGVEFWIDAGFADRDAAQSLLAALGPEAQRVVPVFGSESLASPEALARCMAPPAAGVLSLDRRHERPLDPGGCWTRPGLWPQRLIVMTLDRVGSDAGPDLDTLAEVRRHAPHAELVGAGGIRDAADLRAAQAAGADAWLVASALHDLRLPRAG
ncbi:HisA/HisF-related TIM barrel protein [Caldimonas tepidiphila]|uniref:HisA/HisF-related TIM barrel protein n=1 Tax=Caldimonas tepidiphila TaxID=2315841 RepID=UPI000E5AEA16|nr:HisA/HisF-related TIM barrel protein [Caldimonas tepidiphila]